MKKLIVVIVLIGIFYSFISVTSCRPSIEVSGKEGTYYFSEDTISFDTVFTTIGNATQNFKIYNKENYPIAFQSISIASGNGSMYRLNINGNAGTEVKDVIIEPYDSIYVFVNVVSNQGQVNTPFLILDSIKFVSSTKVKYLPLLAFGQDAYFHIKEHITSNTIWASDKPHVIYDTAFVDAGTTLILDPKVRVYMHQNATLYVDGTLKAIGSKSDSIIFQGDRLDRAYFLNSETPGEWMGIYFSPKSSNSILSNVVIKNAMIGIQVDSLSNNTNYKLNLIKTQIANCFISGIRTVYGSVYAENCLFHTSTRNVEILRGGDSKFVNCTLGAYSTQFLEHSERTKSISLFIIDYQKVNDIYVAAPLRTEFSNCIIYGGLDEECTIDVFNSSTQAFDVIKFNNCIFKTKGIPSYVLQSNCLINQDPKFINYEKWNFRLDTGSAALDKGLNILTSDLDNNPRSGISDIGCYEK